MKAICSLLILVVLISSLTNQHPSGTGNFSQNSFRLDWKLPVGDMGFVSVSDDGHVLIQVLYDGYYDYDADGRLAWRLSDPRASYGELSADGKSALLVRQAQTPQVKARAFLIDSNSLKEQWYYSLDVIDYARLSAASLRTAIVGRNFAAGIVGSQKLLAVLDRNGKQVLNVTFGGEYDFDSSPAISRDGRYVAVATWGRYEKDSYWLYFFDLESKISWKIPVHNGVKWLAISPNATVAAAGPDGLRLFDKNGNLLWSRPLPGLFLESYFIPLESRLRISQSGEYIAVAGTSKYDITHGGHVILFDRKGEQLWDLGPSTDITAFAMDEASSKIVVGDSSGYVYVLDRSGTVPSKRHLSSSIRSVAIGETSPIIAAVGNENTMYAMDTQANLLWTHKEIGSSNLHIQTTLDGRRSIVGYTSGQSSGAIILDDVGKRLTGPILTAGAGLSALSCGWQALGGRYAN